MNTTKLATPERRTPRRIVVGVDLSPASRGALSWAQLLAHRVDAEVVIAHAFGLQEAAASELIPSHAVRVQLLANLDRDWCAPGDPLLGSVSRRVVHETSLPTLVVPGSWAEPLLGETDRGLAATDGATTATSGHGGA